VLPGEGVIIEGEEDRLSRRRGRATPRYGNRKECEQQKRAGEHDVPPGVGDLASCAPGDGAKKSTHLACDSSKMIMPFLELSRRHGRRTRRAGRACPARQRLLPNAKGRQNRATNSSEAT